MVVGNVMVKQVITTLNLVTFYYYSYRYFDKNRTLKCRLNSVHQPNRPLIICKTWLMLLYDNSQAIFLPSDWPFSCPAEMIEAEVTTYLPIFLYSTFSF